MSSNLIGDAIISECGQYRYLLQRSWNPQLEAVCFVMLNPSTADAMKNDPTILRCIAFAKAFGFGQLEVVNLYAFRASDPKALLSANDPIGPLNDASIIDAVSTCHEVICAWGTKSLTESRERAVLNLISICGKKPKALKITKERKPSHPLYLPASSRMLDYVI